jgi:hypothetical protein
LSDGDDHGIEDIDEERAAREVFPDDDDPDERKKAFAITVAATGCRLLLTKWAPPSPHALSTASRYIAYFLPKTIIVSKTYHIRPHRRPRIGVQLPHFIYF